jgi:hypothetical protein
MIMMRWQVISPVHHFCSSACEGLEADTPLFEETELDENCMSYARMKQLASARDRSNSNQHFIHLFL